MTTLEHAFGFNTIKTSRGITRLLAHYLKPYNLTPEQWKVLNQLHAVNHINQKELSFRTDKDQATLTKILDLLVKRNLVERKPNPDDRRSFLICNTPEGQKLNDEVSPLVEELFAKIIDGISDEHLEIYGQVLGQLQQNINHIRE